ncbi:MAG: glycosyltransferase family 2 protein [Acidobacteria bacterium]|nr:MAG: glycosyltransferase family 2 protein [Acidobacteriota bacterium]
MRMRLSVVIVSWNTRELLRNCLLTVVSESKRLEPASVEVFVVDNGSTDGTVEMIRENFPSTTLIANRENIGFAAANNQALTRSNGDYVLLLNPDTELRPDALGRMVRFLDLRMYVGAVGPLLVSPDGSMQESCFPRPTLFREFWRLLYLDRLLRLAAYPMATWGLERPRDVETVQGACILMKRSVLDKIGLLDPNFFIYTEEIDLCRRIRSAGWRIYWLPAATVVHHGGQSTRQAASAMFIELYRSKLHYFRKHYGWTGGIVYKLILLICILPRLVLPPVALAFSIQRTKMLSVLRLYRLLLLELKSL